jgi:hypothetical protein
MEETLRADGETVPAGGLDRARDPMPLPRETAAAARAMAEAEEGDPNPGVTLAGPPARAAEGEAAAPVSIDPPLAG